MSSDKRTVSTDALETLGTIHTRQEYRDAIHLAVEPVIAGERLSPGQHIYLKDGKAFTPHPGEPFTVGIVDPFLPEAVKPGESFWLVVYPRMITSLRHVWSHPDFPEEPSVADLVFPNTQLTVPAKSVEPLVETTRSKKQAARLWIENYAKELKYDEDPITADELITYGTDYFRDSQRNRYPDYLVKGDALEGVVTSEMFWEQLEIYLDEEIPKEYRGNFFSCSC